jgi:hypothetical protein
VIDFLKMYFLWGLFPAVICVGIIWGWVKLYDITIYSFFELKTYLEFFPVVGLLAFILVLVLKLGPGN